MGEFDAVLQNYFLVVQEDGGPGYRQVTQDEYDERKKDVMYPGPMPKETILQKVMETHWRLHGSMLDAFYVLTSMDGQSSVCFGGPSYGVDISVHGRGFIEGTYHQYPDVHQSETFGDRATAVARHLAVVQHLVALDAQPPLPGETDLVWLTRLYDEMNEWLDETRQGPTHCACIGSGTLCDAFRARSAARKALAAANSDPAAPASPKGGHRAKKKKED